MQTRVSIPIPYKMLGDGPDFQLGCLSNDATLAQLQAWRETAGIHRFPPDMHRLQIEYWLWEQRAELVGRVMDVGVEIRRDWIGGSYFTLGERDCDVIGDIQHLDMESETLDVVICTEVMEHVQAPFQATAEIWRALKPGGLLFASSPFMWPDHHCDNYADYWRLTPQGWQRLLAEFSEVTIKGCQWTEEAKGLMDLVRRFEGMGWRNGELMATGYFVRAVK